MALEEPPFGFQSTHAVIAQSRSFQRKLKLSSQSSNICNNQGGFNKDGFLFPFYKLKGFTMETLFCGCPRQEPNLPRNDLVPFLNGTPKTSRSSRTKSKTSSIQRKKPRLQWRKKTNEPQSSSTTEQTGEVQILQSLLTPTQKAMTSKPTHTNKRAN